VKIFFSFGGVVNYPKIVCGTQPQVRKLVRCMSINYKLNNSIMLESKIHIIWSSIFFLKNLNFLMVLQGGKKLI
jgi:hypothetical protein